MPSSVLMKIPQFKINLVMYDATYNILIQYIDSTLLTLEHKGEVDYTYNL